MLDLRSKSIDWNRQLTCAPANLTDAYLFFCFMKAIESGRLPGDFLDDIPCKYVDGTLVCEVSNHAN